MAEYIERRAALNIVEFECGEWSGLARTIVEEIESIPAADVAPVVHGRWNQLDNGGFVCSVCMGGYKAQPTRMGKPMFEYCPICGAKMEGGDEHE